MPTYVYSQRNSKRNQNISNVTNNNMSSSVPKRPASVNRPMVSLVPKMRKSNKNVNGTLKYQTIAPRLVKKNYVQRENGGFNLKYHLKNAKIVTAKKQPKLMTFIQVAKIISPHRVR
jgi:hypothetical protein